MTDEEISKEISEIQNYTHPLYQSLEDMGDNAFRTSVNRYSGGGYTPEAQAIVDKIKPYAERQKLIEYEVKRREQEIANRKMWEERDKRVAEALIFQKKNGWEIVKEGSDYVLRHPETKEDHYRNNKIKRVREVALESPPVIESKATVLGYME